MYTDLSSQSCLLEEYKQGRETCGYNLIVLSSIPLKEVGNDTLVFAIRVFSLF